MIYSFRKHKKNSCIVKSKLIDYVRYFIMMLFVVQITKVGILESMIFVCQIPQADTVIVFRSVIIKTGGVVFVSVTSVSTIT